MHNPHGPAWIPVTEADKMLLACSDRQSVLRDLDDLVARGGMRVWATGVTSLYRNQAGSSRQPSGPVQAVTWAAIRSSALDPGMWATGVVTVPATPDATGFVLKGIRLEREPFLHLLEEYELAASHLASSTVKAVPVTAPPPPLSSAGSRGPGGTTKWKEWDRVWSSIVILAAEDRLNRAEFPSQAELMKEVRNIQGGDELFSDRILKSMISKIYKEFVRAD